MLSNDPSAKQGNDFRAMPESESPMLIQATEECWKAVMAHVLANGGTRADAEDLVHDAILVMHNRIRKSSLKLTGSPGAYLFGICKNEWLHRLREKKRGNLVTNQIPVEYRVEHPAEAEWRLAERYRLYIEKLDTLGDPCRLIIELDCQKVPLKEIARMLNYTYEYIRHKKPDCIAKLTSLIRQDPRFNGLI